MIMLLLTLGCKIHEHIVKEVLLADHGTRMEMKMLCVVVNLVLMSLLIVMFKRRWPLMIMLLRYN